MFLLLCVPVVLAEPTRSARLCSPAGLVVCRSFAILACGAHIVLRLPSETCVTRCKLCTIYTFYMLYMCEFAKVKDWCHHPLAAAAAVAVSCADIAGRFFSPLVYLHHFVVVFKSLLQSTFFSPFLSAWTLLLLRHCCTSVPSLHILLPGKRCVLKNKWLCWLFLWLAVTDLIDSDFKCCSVYWHGWVQTATFTMLPLNLT